MISHSRKSAKIWLSILHQSLRSSFESALNQNRNNVRLPNGCAIIELLEYSSFCSYSPTTNSWSINFFVGIAIRNSNVWGLAHVSRCKTLTVWSIQ